MVVSKYICKFGKFKKIRCTDPSKILQNPKLKVINTNEFSGLRQFSNINFVNFLYEDLYIIIKPIETIKIKKKKPIITTI